MQMSIEDDVVFLKKRPQWDPEPVPASDPAYVKHVSCEGARFHVIWWDAKGAHCSEPRCIVNRPMPPKETKP